MTPDEFEDNLGNRPEVFALTNEELKTLTDWLWDQFAAAYVKGYDQCREDNKWVI